MSERKPIPNRYTSFLAKVDVPAFRDDMCWEWTGCVRDNGYGHLTVRRKSTSAHRYAYELFVGPVPKDLDVCHTCDNRLCVNPDHLFLGTRAENMEDARRKGRLRIKGRKHLKPSQIQEIVARLKSGHSARRIAKDTGMKYATVSALKAGRSYSKITGFGA